MASTEPTERIDERRWLILTTTDGIRPWGYGLLPWAYGGTTNRKLHAAILTRA